MEIEFLKMRGCADDVIVVEQARLRPGADALLPGIARAMLDRRRGVGGTAVLVLGATEDTVTVRCLDPDGDDAAPGGNAVRCAARYASDAGRVSVSAFTLAGHGRTQRVQIIDSINVRVDMGPPFDSGTTRQISEAAPGSFTREITVEGRRLTYTPIALATPYAVFLVPDFSFPLKGTARAIAGAPEFPSGTGIGFLQVVSREEIRLRSWGEETDDCDCASAALVASVVNGFTDREVFVRMTGGDLFLQWDEADNRIWLTGPAAYVFTGTYDHAEADTNDEEGSD
jgi:diaminopimelate epimerase